MAVIKQGKMQMANELVGWRHFINLKIQNTIGGKNLGSSFGSWWILGELFLHTRETKMVAGN
jgi:hypothetical protein